MRPKLWINVDTRIGTSQEGILQFLRGLTYVVIAFLCV